MHPPKPKIEFNKLSTQLFITVILRESPRHRRNSCFFSVPQRFHGGPWLGALRPLSPVSKTGSTKIGCKRRDDIAPRAPLRTCPAGAGSGRRRLASGPHNGPSHLPRIDWLSNPLSCSC